MDFVSWLLSRFNLLKSFGVSDQVSVVIYLIVHILTYLGVMHQSRKHFKHKDNKELTTRLEPFHRVDIDRLKSLAIIPLIFTFWPRFTIGVVNLFLYAVEVQLIMLGQNEVSPLRYKIVKFLGYCHCRF